MSTNLYKYVWRSGKIVTVLQIEYFKINMVSESPFIYEYDASYMFCYFYNSIFGISQYKIFWQSQTISI